MKLFVKTISAAGLLLVAWAGYIYYSGSFCCGQPTEINKQESEYDENINTPSSKGLEFKISNYGAIYVEDIILPVQITGTVDISKWTAFEANAGVVKIYGYHNGEERLLDSEPVNLDNFDYDISRLYSFSLTVGDREWMGNLSSNKGRVVFENYSAKDGSIINMISEDIIFDLPLN